MMEYLNRLLGFVETNYRQARIMGVSEFVMSHEVIIRLVFFWHLIDYGSMGVRGAQAKAYSLESTPLDQQYRHRIP